MKAQIMVVEDEGIVALDLQSRLQSLGYGVPAVASSGEEAIARAAENRPDLVLMDIKLKGEIDGVEAAEQIRARFQIPVIYLTAYADEATLQRARVTEPFGYILKPFEERELSATIEMALYRHDVERRSRESERWLFTTLKSIGDAVIATDGKGRISFINPVAETLTGWKHKEALGQDLTRVFHIINEETRTVIENPGMEALRTGVVTGLRNHTILIAKDGTEISIDDSAAPIRDDQENMTGVVLVFRDITKRRRAEEALQRKTRQQEQLLETARHLTASLDVEKVLTRIGVGASEILGACGCAIYLLEADGKTLTPVVAIEPPYEEETLSTSIKVDTSFTGQVVKAKRGLIFNDAGENISGQQVPGTPVEREERVIAAPFVVDDAVIGAMCLNRVGPLFSEDDLALAEAFATYAATSLKNAQTYHDLQCEVEERKRAEEALRQRTAQLEALREVGLEVTAQLDLDDLLRSIACRATELLGGTQSELCLYRPERDVLERAVSSDPDIVPIRTIFHRGEGLSGKVWETGEPLIVNDYRHWDGRADAWESCPIIAVVGVPVRWGREFLGVLNVRADPPRTFAPADVELLDLLATQAATAIRNARLYEAEQKRAAQLAVVNQVARKAVSILDPDRLLQEIVTAIQRGFDYHNVTLLQLDETAHELGRQAMAGGFEDLASPDYRQTMGEGLIGWTAETGQTLLVNDVSQEPRYIVGFSEEIPTRSEMCVPLKLGNRVVGVLDVQETEVNAFDETDLTAIETLADQIAVAIENARLFQAERTQRELAEALREATVAISSTLQVDEVIDRVLAQLQEVVPYDTASVQLLRASLEQGRREDRLEIVGGRGFPNLEELLGVTFDPNREDNPNQEVVRTRESFIVTDAPAVYAEFSNEPHAAAGIRSWLGVPMLVGERLIGMIALDKSEPGFYTPAHARLAEAFAAQAAIALENGRLFQAEQKQRELAQALEEAAAAVSSTLDLDLVLDHILEQVEQVVVGDAFNIMLMKNGAAQMVRQRGYERLDLEDSASATTIPFAKYPSLLKMMQTGKPALIQNTTSDPDWVLPQGQEWRRSYVAAPIRVRDTIVGFLNVNGTRTDQFGPADAQRLEAFANHAATAIENAQLYQQLRDHADQLEQRVRERTAQLAAQYARLETILHSASDGIVVTDAGGEILQTNPVAQAWLARTLSPEDAARLREAVRDLARRAEERPEMVLELKGLDLQLTAAPISKPRIEEPAAAVVAIHDVSHLKALDRMKTHFVSNISHELRTPITTIKLYAHLMRQQPEKWEEYLDVLAEEADHQARLVESILQISRIDAGRLEMDPHPTFLNELTEATTASHYVLAREQGLTLEYHPSPQPSPRRGEGAGEGPVALVDPERIRQVLNNLVGNAIRYTPEGGTVTVSTGEDEAQGRMWATITVRDTGIGIPEKDLPHIFDRFFRGMEPRSMQISGTGLGLAITEEIVELHGGRVTVESEEGVGSTFTVWLPLAD
jgi:PAS domain S-box-containing protein